jgi:hypothetical protein
MGGAEVLFEAMIFRVEEVLGTTAISVVVDVVPILTTIVGSVISNYRIPAGPFCISI